MTNGNLGEVVAPAGDFNGDGAMDMLLAAPNTDLGKGRAYVIYGSGSSSPPFTLLDVEPVSGPIRGGTRVLIRGSGFETGAQVFFGDRAAGNVAVATGSEIRAVTPAFDVPGVVDVVVKNNGQTKRLNGAFEYVPNLPAINLDQLGSRGLRLDGEAGKVIGGSLA